MLIVEDEAAMAHDIRRCVIDLGYDALAICSSADEALARAGERRPDVALVDVRIKGKLSGIKTARLLQERFGVPIVYLAADAADAELERALRARPAAYLLTPVNQAEMQRAIRTALLQGEAGGGERNPPAPEPGAPAPAPALRASRAPTVRAVRNELEQILQSADFDAPRRSRDFLRFVVEEALAGRGDAITQDAIATRVFGRRDDFDAIVDPIVRIQAGRLRRSLERYYLLAGREDRIRIELPKGTYVPAFRGVRAAEEGGARAGDAAAGLAAAGAPALRRDDGWPSLVLSAFEASGAGNDAADRAERVTEELALELARYRAVRVLQENDRAGRDPAGPDRVRFALGGRLRADAEGLRITARLVDRATGELVWGDEYHSAPAPKPWSGVPDDVARVIAARVAAEEGVVVQLLAAERRKRRPAEPTPYDAFLLSYEFFLARDAETLRSAVEALRRVVHSDPDEGLAWTRLARLQLADYAFELTAAPAPIDEAITCAQRGVRLDPESRSARCVLASALLVKGELAAGRNELEQALRTSPGSLVYLEIIGYLLTLLGDWERGAAVSRSARERNPHCLPHLLLGMWADGLRRGDVEVAYQAALEYRDPTFFWRSVMRASCLGLLGRTQEAKAEVAEILSVKPGFAARGRILLGHYLKFPEILGPVVDGLARAGLHVE